MSFPRLRFLSLHLLVMAAVFGLCGRSFAKDAHGLKNATVLIIRHAEKPEGGPNLSAIGDQRAQAYVNYFQHFQVGSETLQIDALIAASDSQESSRPRLTLEPLGKALGIPVDTRFKVKQVNDLVADLRSRHPHLHGVLISWRHGEIPELLTAFGADYHNVLPKGEWPADVFDGVVVLHFDHDGHLESAKYQVEGLKIGG